MVKIKFNRIKSSAGIVCLLGIAVIFSACGGGSYQGRVEYTFNNQSGKTIYVTLDRLYETEIKVPTENGEKTEYVKSETKTLSVSSGAESEVYVQSESVNFSWTCQYESDNMNIYCVVDRNEATFRNR
jgi:hypothetical protein